MSRRQRRQVAADLQAPLIVIGAGRSGTTLLMRALRAHPQISFHGETSFLPARLWQQTVIDRFWYNWKLQFKLDPESAVVPLPPMTSRCRKALESRAGLMIAEHVSGLLGVRASAPVWGFKELWNGSSSFNVDWAVYDAIFPRATWLHIVRNPFTHATSSARWNAKRLTREHLQNLLTIWTDIQCKSQERQETGRYHHVRFEDMVADPEASLAPVLLSLGLDWSAKCADAFAQTHFTSRRLLDQDAPMVDFAPQDYADAIPRFIQQCECFKYLEPQRVAICEEAVSSETTEISFFGANIVLG